MQFTSLRIRSLLTLAGLSVFSCAKMVPPAAPGRGGRASAGPGQYVNPLIGTAAFTDPKLVGYVAPADWHGVWAGLAFPGSALPNAMVQLSPVTEFNTGSGYQYEDSVIQAFAHTNKGHWNLCHLPVLPAVGPANASGGYASRFSHTTETAAPGYYGVTLQDYNVRVRLTSTLRCGLHQYYYAQPQDRSIVFKLGRSNENVNDWNIEKVGTKAVLSENG
jgi:putative alpha-1,2-mannosidase